MFSQYFGQYLLNRGMVTTTQLMDVLNHMQSVRLKLGVLAINAGCMSASEVGEVHRLQKEMDRKFGEIAVQKGYLTVGQLENLLSSQKTGNLLLGQALVDRQYLSLEQFQTMLNEYKKDHGLSEEQFSALQQDNIEEIVNVFIKLDGSRRVQLYKNYISLLVKNMIRFLDESPRVETGTVSGQYSVPWVASQEICGEIEMYTALAAGEEVFLDVGGRFAGERFDKPDELAQASVSEFLNQHNGVFLVNMSNSGVELRLKPQAVSSQVVLSSLKSPHAISFYLSKGKIDLILAEKEN